MATVSVEKVEINNVPYTAQATQPPNTTDLWIHAIRHDEIKRLLGQVQCASLLSTANATKKAFFHDGCAYIQEDDGRGTKETLYTTSALLQATNAAELPVILISRIRLHRTADGSHDVHSLEWAKLRPPSSMPMPSSAIPFPTGPEQTPAGILYCAQGNLQPQSSGLFFMPTNKPPQPILTSYFGRDFNSVRDAVVAPDGAIWFTDPCYGFEHRFRNPPSMPCHVYRYHAATSDLRVMTDSVQRPTGICISPDGKTVYVSDTEALHYADTTVRRAETVYAFDVEQRAGADVLLNKRVFAYPIGGAAIGIQCDVSGNVFAACADGLEIWTPGGMVLGPSKCQAE